MNNEPLLQIRELRKSFGDQKVLDGIDLDVGKGETLIVLGRSGSGKSVLLKLIIGLQKPDSGSIRIGNVEVTNLKTAELDEVRKKIGFLFQSGALYDSMTVKQNLEFPLRRIKKNTGKVSTLSVPRPNRAPMTRSGTISPRSIASWIRRLLPAWKAR